MKQSEQDSGQPGYLVSKNKQVNGQPSYLVSIFSEAARVNPAAAKYVEFEEVFSPDLICKRAWSPSLFEPKERAQPNFVSASVIGYDFDSGKVIEDMFLMVLCMLMSYARHRKNTELKRYS